MAKAKKRNTSGISDRERRRQRRVRNQILSYITLIVLIVCIVAGIFFALRFVTKWLREKKQQENPEKETEIIEETETEEAEETDSGETAAYTEEDLLDDIVTTTVAGMPLEDQVAGLFLTTPEALTGVDRAVIAGDGTQEALAKYPVGGIVYSASNVESAKQFTKMITDTISKSKYQLFLLLDEETDLLTEDLSVYGINTEFTEKDGNTFQTVTLPSLLGDAQATELVTVQIEGEEDTLAESCLEAWENGANLLYVQDGVQAAYEGLLAKIQGDPGLEDKVRESIETIYYVKCDNPTG